jgi:hypothetical protein
MEKISEWLTSMFEEHPLSLLFYVLGALLLLLGVSNGFNLPVLNQVASDPNFRWVCVVLGVLGFAFGTFIYYRPPKNSDKKPKDFWQVLLGAQPNKNVYVILSAKQGFEWEQGTPIAKPGHTALLSYNEVIAFLGLQDALQQIKLQRIKERLILVHGGVEDSQNRSINIPDFPVDETLIIIGSPHANKVCQSILSSPRIPQLPFRFETNENGKCINLYQDEKGQWRKNPVAFFPSFIDEPGSPVDDLEEDFGIILRVTNPRDADGKNKILIMGGNHGLGTESAVSFVADKDRVKSLHDFVKDQDFEALFQAAVSKKRGLNIGIRKLAVLKNGVWVPIPIA